MKGKRRILKKRQRLLTAFLSLGIIVIMQISGFGEAPPREDKPLISEMLASQASVAVSSVLLDSSAQKIQCVLQERKEQEQAKKLMEEQKARKHNTASLPSRGGYNISPSERKWLEKIVMAEAGGEPYEGQLAVANVVLNRVKARFGRNVYEVIFQEGQFTPAMNGKIYSVVPSESVKRAVEAALRGERAVGEDVLYFVNPDIAQDLTIPKTKTFVKRIGNHCFYK